jgi:aminopeptidase N
MHHYLDLVLAGIDKEKDIGVMQSLVRITLRGLEIYADPHKSPAGYAAFADKAFEALPKAEPGSDHQLAWVHALLGAMRSDEHAAFARGLLDGSQHVPGLAVDDELRWSVVQALSARGVVGPDEIQAELDRDPSAAGQRHAATARALQPTPEAKAAAWHSIVEDDSLPNAMQEAVIAGFAPASQGELVAPYARRYFEDVREVWERRTSELAQNVVVGLFPSWSSTITDETVALADEFLADQDVPFALRRLVSEGRADILRALRARQADRSAALAQ